MTILKFTFFLRAGVTIWGLGDFGKKILNLGLFKNFCWAKFPILEFFLSIFPKNYNNM